MGGNSARAIADANQAALVVKAELHAFQESTQKQLDDESSECLFSANVSTRAQVQSSAGMVLQDLACLKAKMEFELRARDTIYATDQSALAARVEGIAHPKHCTECQSRPLVA
jgi:hypothetical protein